MMSLKSCNAIQQTILVLALCFMAGTNCAISTKEDDDEQRLLEDLFSNYNPRLRPVIKKSDAVTVTLGISLHQIIDVDEKNQLLKTSIWVRQKWKNPLLAWNESEYGGIKSINVESSQIWKPDIYLYNNADHEREGGMDQFKTHIVIESSGWTKWLAPIVLSSSCKMDVEYFPFDQQVCDLKFGSWTYDGFRVDVVSEAPFADTKKFVSNGEWQLISFPAKRNEIYYVCCKEPYPDVTFTLHIQRLALFYYMNLIIPCLVITALTLAAFYLPPDSGERITLVITNLLAMTVFMLLVAEIMPSTSETVPIISIYFSGTIFEVSVALLATCLVLKCHFQNPAVAEMPVWVRYVVLKWMARIFRVKLPNKRRTSVSTEASTPENPTLHRMNGATDLNTTITPKVGNNCRQRSPLLDAQQNEMHSLVKDISYSNLMNGKYKSPNAPSRADSIPRRTTSQVEDWELASNFVSQCCNDDHGQWCTSEPCAQLEFRGSSRSNEHILELLKMQKQLLEHVGMLAKVVSEQERIQVKKEEWSLVAMVIDKAFRVTFLFMFIVSTLVIFKFSKT